MKYVLGEYWNLGTKAVNATPNIEASQNQMGHGQHLMCSYKAIDPPEIKMVEESNTRRTRASHPKVRSGCQACK
jgi:hypothetical protein